MARYAQQVAPASAGGGNLIGWVPTVGAAWQDCPNGYGGAGSFFKQDGSPFWGTTEWEMTRIPTNSGNADGYVEGVFTPAGDDWIMSVFLRSQVDGQRYQLTLSGSSGNSWISLESGAGGFPGTVVAATTHGIAASNRGTHTIRLTATGTGFEGSLNGAAPFITGTNATLAAVGYAGQGGRSLSFRSLDAFDTTGGGTPPGIATEADTALALAAQQIKAVGLATETDIALALAGPASSPVGLATETDTALALTSPAGFDFHSAAGLIFGDLAGALTSLARQAAVNMVLRVYAVASPGALVVESGTLTTDSNGRLARFTHASLVAGTAYHCMLIRASDGEIVSAKIAAT